jgi:hypothetical protein
MMIQVMKKLQTTSLLVIRFSVKLNYARLLVDTSTRRKLKAREAFTVPFRFLCDYGDQSEEHMSSIETKLEITKGEIA